MAASSNGRGRYHLQARFERSFIIFMQSEVATDAIVIQVSTTMPSSKLGLPKPRALQMTRVEPTS